MLAGPAAVKLATPAAQPFQVVRLCCPPGQPAAGGVDGAQAKQAWPALTGTLRGEVLDDPGRCIDPAGFIRQEVEYAASKGMAATAKGRRRQRQRPDAVDPGPASEVPAQQDGLNGTPQATRASS